MAAGAENVANKLIDRLEQAWNEADGRAIGERFTADADFVDIRGEHHSGTRGYGPRSSIWPSAPPFRLPNFLKRLSEKSLEPPTRAVRNRRNGAKKPRFATACR